MRLDSRVSVRRAGMLFLLTLSAASPTFGQAASEPAPIPTEEVIPTIRWDQAGQFVGQEVFLVGKVVRTGKSRSGHVFLNFDPDYRGTATIFVRDENTPHFPEPPEKLYKGKLIKVRGFVYEHANAPNLAAARPDVITVLPDDAPLPPRASQPSPAPPTPRGEITVASYNVLNLFDAHDEPYRSDDASDAKPREQLAALAASIRQINADVLGLCEVENRDYLERFVRAFLGDMGYGQVVLFEGNDRRGIDVAVLSRLPVGPVTSHRHLRFPDARGKPIGFRRDLLRVRVEPENGDPFEVFVVHLKSKGGEEDGGIDVRLPEARMTRAVLDGVLKKDPAAAFLICGDFNDTIDSEPVSAIVGSGPTALTTFIDEVPAEQRITYNQPPHYSMIDFIFASPAMAKRYVPGSCRIIEGSPASTGSDHNAVVARFRLK